ncbi:MAG: DUF2905 domain-containing protein [Flavobacteriales bacterium]
MQEIGKYLLITGLFLTFIGGVIWALGDKSGWFGSLPGDIRIERKNFRFYMPLSSMLLLSVFLSLLVWVIQKLLR